MIETPAVDERSEEKVVVTVGGLWRGMVKKGEVCVLGMGERSGEVGIAQRLRRLMDSASCDIKKYLVRPSDT